MVCYFHSARIPYFDKKSLYGTFRDLGKTLLKKTQKTQFFKVVQRQLLKSLSYNRI